MPRREAVSMVWLVGTLAILTGCALFPLAPDPQFDVSPVVVYAGDKVEFDAGPSTSGSTIVAYTWDLGNGTIVDGRRVTASFQAPGIYTVELTVEDSSGRTGTVTREVTVYVRSGTRILYEDFATGPDALDRWSLDPTWASEEESSVEYIAGDQGYVLRVWSSEDQWHRLYTSVTIPPLRVGQEIIFSCRAMTADTQGAHTFIIVPARPEISTPTGSLPYFEFTGQGNGSYVREPSAYGTVIGHPILFVPDVYRWHTYTFRYDPDSYELSVDGVAQQSGLVSAEIAAGGEWFVLLGEESSTEACSAYFDDIRVSIEE